MRSKLLIGWVLLVPTCWSDEGQIRRLLRVVINQVADRPLPQHEEFFAKVNEVTVGALSPAEVNGLLPLAKQCLQSSRLEARQYGLSFFLGVGLRPDSSKLLEPYMDDLGALINAEKGTRSLGREALFVLGNTRPALLPKAISYLSDNLENKDNSPGETLTIAAALLVAFPSDEGIVHKVLSVVRRRAQAELTDGVVRQLGLIKTRSRVALDFIGTCLDDSTPGIRVAAVDAASGVDRDVRARFAAQLGRIAGDSKEAPNTRSQAAAALQQQ